jgi:hypothetical protein
MFDDRTERKVFLEKPDGRRKAGRSKLRWLDSIECDLISKGVKRWMKKAEDRSAWTIILQEALVKLQGPYAEEKEEARFIRISTIVRLKHSRRECRTGVTDWMKS